MHFSKILVPVDFSATSVQALELAAYESKMEGAEIRVLHVYQYFHAPVSCPELPTPLIGAEQFEANRQALQSRLDELVAKHFHGQKVIAEVMLSLNSAADAICWYAKEHGSQVIVIGSRGHTALAGLLLGSTVQRVLLKGERPVLVVPQA